MLARIALILSAKDPSAVWYAETAGFYGLVCEVFREGDDIALNDFDVVVCCGRGGQLPLSRIEPWLQAGGALVCCGDAWNLESLQGHEPGGGRFVGSGSLLPSRNGNLWPDDAGPIKFMAGHEPKVTVAHVLATCKTGRPGLTRFQDAWFLGPDLGQTCALLKLGRAVVSGSSGSETGDVDYWNEPLRAEQGSVLDLNQDRSQGCFVHPHADALADLWIGIILSAAEAIGKSPALIWPWPGGAPCTALVSAECDSAEPDDVYALDRALRYTATPASLFCPPTLLPADVLRRFREEGAEIGLLAEEMDCPEHVTERLKVQSLSLMRLSGHHSLNFMRPQDGKWHGHAGIYESAERAGFRTVASKGPRQSGTTGFLFGTSRHFWASSSDGGSLSVLEVPHSVFEPGNHAAEQAVESLMSTVASRHGCFHISLKASHMRVPVQAAALRTSILAAKSHFATFITLERLSNFERVRKRLRILPTDRGFAIVSDTPLANLAILTTAKSITGNEMKSFPGTVRRLGREFCLGIVSLDGVTSCNVQIGSRSAQRAA